MDKVIVAMSGGVDSNYAAWLLKEQGYEVEGLCLDLYEGSLAPEEAVKAGEQIGVGVRVVDKKPLFREKVCDYLYRSYSAGLTPNPCAVCNPAVKFATLAEEAARAGADKIATGHYARLGYDREAGMYWLKRGKDEKKDQSYFLYRLRQEALSKTLFPLGDALKEDVRRRAAAAGLPAASRKDSQDICFIADGDYQGFMRSYERDGPAGIKDAFPSGFVTGDFVDSRGNVLGPHKGLACYTVGQRKNLGVSFGARMYVLALQPNVNQVVVGPEEALYTREVLTAENHFVAGETPGQPLPVTVKLRSGARPAKAVFYPLPDAKGKLIFDAEQRAATPGQCAVYYIGDRVLGGGIIHETS